MRKRRQPQDEPKGPVIVVPAWLKDASMMKDMEDTYVTGCITLAVILLTWYMLPVFGYLRNLPRRSKYNKWIGKVRHERSRRIHPVLNETPFAPILSVVETNRRVIAGKLKPYDAVVSSAHRCRKFGMSHKAIAEELYDWAEAQAHALVLPSSPSLLYGVPISIKESYAIENCLSTGGLACRLGNRNQTDALMVSILRDAGALFMCTGNTIQLMMLAESDNRIWGRCENPWNRTRVPGGSSGGDAALVALRCVSVALASDVAGSIRIPASFCGVVGIKPTSKRISGVGNMKPRKDNKAGTTMIITPSNGPIARSVEDCVAFLKTMWVSKFFESDQNVAPLPFNDVDYASSRKKMKIAYFTTDGWFEPCVTSQRAVRESIDGLTKAGHLCTKIDIPVSGWDTYALLVSINAGEGGMKSYLEALEGEELIPQYHFLRRASNIPNWMRPFLAVFLDSRRGHLVRLRKLTVFEMWKKIADVSKLKEIWSEAIKGYDAVVFPANPVPAPPHGLTGKITSMFSYYFIANMLDWPCGTVPVTVVREGEDHYDNCPYDDFYTRLTKNQIMKGSVGMPIGVSVMTTAYRDEKCLAVMREIEKAVKFDAQPDIVE